MSDRPTLMIPTIHLNGTSRDALLDPIFDAMHAIYEAGAALAKTAPNGRDYYPQGPQAINAAMDQHEARMNKLREVVAELEQMGERL